MTNAYVCGVGLSSFLKPSPDNPKYYELGKTAATRAMMDSGISIKDVKAAVGGFVYG